MVVVALVRENDRHRRQLTHDPEKACPGLDPGWEPVSRLHEAECRRFEVPTPPAAIS
jgi:hypothetical protein